MTDYLKQWLYCLKQYALMCVFASGPQRLPNSPVCIVLSIFAYFLVGFALVGPKTSYASIIAQILYEVALLALLAYVGLKWKSMLSRFTQTWSALIGINLIISAVTIPVFRMLTDSSTTTESIESKVLYVTMLMIFWNLAVLSQIIKNAFEIKTVMAAMIVFNYFLLYQFTVVWFT